MSDLESFKEELFRDGHVDVGGLTLHEIILIVEALGFHPREVHFTDFSNCIEGNFYYPCLQVT